MEPRFSGLARPDNAVLRGRAHFLAPATRFLGNGLFHGAPPFASSVAKWLVPVKITRGRVPLPDAGPFPVRIDSGRIYRSARHMRASGTARRAGRRAAAPHARSPW